MCPKDGNCLFTALAVAGAICKNHHLLPFSDRKYLGARTRAVLLEQIESWQKKGDEFLPDSDGEISIKSLLVDSQRWDGIDDYLEGMKPPIKDKRQWGGWAESFCVAWMMHAKVLCFLENSDASLSLACEPYGHPRPHYQLCLLWSGSHYDVLTWNPEDLEAFLNAP